MRLNILFFSFFILSLALAMILIFYQNRVLFYLHGYDRGLINAYTAESFAAYKAVYKTKIVLLFVGFFLSLITWLLSLKVTVGQYPIIHKILQWGSFAIMVLFLVLICMFYILPKRLI